MTDKTEAQYGTWQSPVTSSYLTVNCRKFNELRLDQTEKGRGFVYWSESRPSEAGRTVVCSRIVGGNVLQWTPDGFDVRTKVHEYGGGAFFVHSGALFFSNGSDNRIYKQDAFNQPPVPVTVENLSYRYADGCFNNGFIYCVREDHSTSDAMPINTIVYINISTGAQAILLEGADFYASPKVSPDGSVLMWMQWKHPNLPWDDTEIWIANLNENGSVQAGSERKIAGRQGVNFMQPRFSPAGKPFYICDETDWWNLYEYNETGNHHNVQELNKELGGPHWVFGADAYAFDPKNSGDVAVSFSSELGIVNLKSELYYKQETGFTHHQYISFGRDGCIYCIANSATRFPTIIRCNVANGETEIVDESRENIDESLVSIPEHVSYRTSAGGMAYGYFYSPKNPSFKGRPKTLPPLVVMAHGGPTGNCTPTLDLKKQYLTSRGFAVLDVNYRGSTGYGRKFRQALFKNWGIYDVEDCCNGAICLAKEQKVDPNMLAITGRSAGGYTVLACLTFSNVFKVGVSHYGIGDLEALAKDTHKFECKYNDQLIGPYPDEAQTYRDRSPLNAVDKLNCAVAFFQGADDKIVPPEHAKLMNEALLKKGLPTALVLFPGEGHGFRVAENIRLAVDGEFYFFCKILGIPIKTFENLIDIKNLEITLSHVQITRA